MRKILIATHGDYAKGALSAAEIIVGKKEHVSTINAYSEAKNLKEALNAYFDTMAADDEVIVLTDIFGGSVNQGVMPYIKDHVFVITGFNLALLLEVLMMSSEGAVDINELRRVVTESAKQVNLVNDMLTIASGDDFDEE